MKTTWNLIIADDESGLRENLRMLFPWEKLGISVVFLASNGQEVLDYMAEHPADLILADIRMPVMDGLTLAQICQERKLPVSIILLSAYADFEYARAAMRYGVSSYLTKPVQYQDLVETFQRITHSEQSLSPSLQPDAGPKDHSDSYLGYYKEIVKKVQQYVQSDVASATLIGAAAQTGLSASYVSTIFHRCLNQTFSDYLNETRMQYALTLLKSGLTVSDTAWKVGYNNPKNFERTFTQYYQKKPYEYLSYMKSEAFPQGNSLNENKS